ncbi:hypothetical protein CLOBOL_02738 [Enterocloster bolteae ATCC BAA-613]|uniref:Uncharacterized protein n=1 Tax=Enterocloster bolteae (strain ATCC BAA-613 / DSM 15670 / CCUG 46953 / JCM 12243 / WAL 16351) TaxID=411902 RepID=A8RQH8_ENTBW|nr:hypothetical protein CLOBOL_02738 [Enterocloster bolteae ATCC BAA-613]
MIHTSIVKYRLLYVQSILAPATANVKPGNPAYPAPVT